MPPEMWKHIMGFSTDPREICYKHTLCMRMQRRYLCSNGFLGCSFMLEREFKPLEMTIKHDNTVGLETVGEQDISST